MHMPPPPEGFQPPLLWGTGDHVSELFEGSGVEPDFEDAEVVWKFDSVDEVADMFENKFGPVMMAKAALEPEGKWDALSADLRAICAEDEAAGRHASAIPGEYLVTKGRRRARPRRRRGRVPLLGRLDQLRDLVGRARRGSARPGRGRR